jgi:glycosyltransferase involved in cell wall biosynthesis
MIRLLITTQTLDKDDPYLGFFHDWVAALADRFASIEVVCLREGKHELPANVRVSAIGKRHGHTNRLLVSLRYVRRVHALRTEYDAVFIHMNAEYVLVAGWYWKLCRVPAALWYNHDEGGLALAIAAKLVNIVFHTSPYAAPARFRNARLMPVGIDTELFSWSDAPRAPDSIYLQGRVARTKRVHVLLEAVAELTQTRAAKAAVVGPQDEAYMRELRAGYGKLIDGGAVEFLGPKPLRETPALCAAREVAVNLTAAGNFDKTGLEALSCGTLLLASSPAYAPFIPEECQFKEADAAALARALDTVLSWTSEKRRSAARKGRERIEREHSLTALADRLREEFLALVG